MSRNVVVVGTQWGDEGKGKIVDLLTDRVGAVVRFRVDTMLVIRWLLATRKRFFILSPRGS